MNLYPKRFILTGTPGSGKTSIIHWLASQGSITIPEAATDIIAKAQHDNLHEPWTQPAFIDAITLLQHDRQLNAAGDLQFYDRSPFCTYALAQFLNYPIPSILSDEIDRCLIHKIYAPNVFFVENLGFIQNTHARQISYADALRFEAYHLDVYQKFGFQIVSIPMDSIQARGELILRLATE